MAQPLPLQPVGSGTSLGVTNSAREYQIETPDYVLFMGEDDICYAKNGETGVLDFGDDDAGYVLSQVIDQLGAAGGLVHFVSGAFPWSTTPAIPASITGKLTIRGAAATTVTLSTAAPRFLDFDRTSDHQTFRNIEISDLTVDCNNVGGSHHIVVGTLIAGATQQRMNLKNIAVRRVTVTNAPTDSTLTNHRLGVWLVVNHPTTSEATQDEISNIVIEDYRQAGGNAAVGVAANGGGATSQANVYLDNIQIRRVYHDLGATPTTFWASSIVQVGGTGFGGSCWIEDVQGYNSGDIGIEVNAFTHATVRNCTMEDCYTSCFYVNNFNSPKYPNAQKITFENCHSRKILVNGGLTTAKGFEIGSSSAYQSIGTVELRDCSHVNKTVSMVAGDAYSSGTANLIRHQIIDGFRVDIEGFDMTITGSNFHSAAVLVGAPASATTRVTLSDIDITVSGTRNAQSTQSLFLYGLSFRGGSNGTHWVDGRNLIFDLTQTNAVSTSMQCVRLAYPGTTPKIGGRLSHGKIAATSGDSAAIGVRVDGTSALLIDRVLDFDYWDFNGLPGSGGTEISFQDATNKPSVSFQHTRWRQTKHPLASSAITPSGSPYSYQNLDGYPQNVVVQGGTVSKVEYSVDNSTFTDLGVTAGSFRVEPGDYLRVTYTGAPTMTKIPNR